MNEHFAKTMHQQKMATYYAEANGSRIAGQSGQPGLLGRIRRFVGRSVRPQPATSAARPAKSLEPQHLSKVG